MDGFSDRGSIPLGSTKIIAGRTPGSTVFVFPYGIVLAFEMKTDRS